MAALRPVVKRLPLEDIVLDPALQPREKINEQVVTEYTEDMTEGVAFPPIVVFLDGAQYLLADGFHRYHAARKAGLSELDCEVRIGTRRDALLFAVGANVAHGLRRSNADKRKAITSLLSDPEWLEWSDREIARRCAVSADLVGEVRKSLTVDSDSEPSTERKVPTKHGTTTLMKTANIGKPEMKPAVEPKPKPKLGPPCRAMQCARIAIMKLEEIEDDDTEREQAIKTVAEKLALMGLEKAPTVSELKDAVRELHGKRTGDRDVAQLSKVFCQVEQHVGMAFDAPGAHARALSRKAGPDLLAHVRRLHRTLGSLLSGLEKASAEAAGGDQ